MFSISVRESGGALHGLYQQLMAGKWQQLDWTHFALGDIRPEIVQASIASWQARLVDEYRSATLFSQFQSLLLWANVPNDLLGCCSRVVQDELRHVQLCGDLVRAMGGEPSATAPAEMFVIPWAPDVPMEKQVLDFAFQYFCLGESLSSHLIEATWKTAGHPMVREALGRLASDERFHSEFGWTVVKTLWPHAEEATVSAIVADLPAQLLRLEQTFVSYGPEAGDVPLPEEYRHLGSLSTGEHRGAFYRGVHDDLLPRLEALGLPGRSAWEARAASASPA